MSFPPATAERMIADHKSETGENPRDLEREQIVRFLNLIAAHIYIGHYDFDVGSGKIESKIQRGRMFPMTIYAPTEWAENKSFTPGSSWR